MKVDARKMFGASTALCLLAGGALAQSDPTGSKTTAPTAVADSSTGVARSVTGENQLGEIIVTATRRATSLQTVTATIDVASAAKLDALNVKDAQGLENLVPGVTVARSGGVTPFIRGIGTFNAGFSEASVGAYIDGIYLPNSSGVLFSFNNIERVEVLKGPQGTLYGRNTIGGLINIITRPPDEQLTVDASVGYANYDTFSQNFYGSTPIAENLTANLAVYHSKQGKGWSQNVFTGHDVQKAEDTGVYGKLQWKPGRDTKVTLSGLYNYENSSRGWAFTILPGTYAPDGTPYQGEHRINAQVDPNAEYHGYLTSLKIDQNLGWADFFSLTGYQYGRQVSDLVIGGFPGKAITGQAAQENYINFNYHTVSEELQLSSKASDSPFDWIAGAFFYHDTTNVTTGLTTNCSNGGCIPPAAAPTLVHTRPTTRSISAYADGTYKITKATRLTIGLRETHEVKGFSGLVEPRPGYPTSVAVLPASVVLTPGAATPPVPSSVSASKLTYRAVLAQDISDKVHGYLSYNRGFKSGNYNPNNITNQPVKPEFLNAAEAGIKSELFDRRLRLNVSAFNYRYTDIQVRSNAGLPAGSPSFSQNIAAARANGIDAQFDVKPFEGFSLNGGFEYLDAKYRSYPGATCTAPRVTPGIGTAVINTPCDLAGYTLPMSPKYSAVVGFAYEMPTRFGSLTFVGNDSYKSRMPLVGDNSIQQGPTHTIDASVKWKSLDERIDVQLFGKNLTNKYKYLSAQMATSYVYVPGEPRTYGLNVGYHLW